MAKQRKEPNLYGQSSINPGHIPIKGSKQIDSSGMGDVNRIMAAREKIMANIGYGGGTGGNFGVDFVAPLIDRVKALLTSLKDDGSEAEGAYSRVKERATQILTIIFPTIEEIQLHERAISGISQGPGERGR